MEKSSCKIFLSCSKLCLVSLEPVYIYIFARKKNSEANTRSIFTILQFTKLKIVKRNSYFQLFIFRVRK